MTNATGQLKAGRPAQLAREMLGGALGGIQDIRNRALDIDDVTASIAKAVGALFAVQSSEPGEPGHAAGVCLAMDHLRSTLKLMQDVPGDDEAIANASRVIAKTLAILYPVSKVQERQSIHLDAPPAVVGEHLAHDHRRSVQRIAIEAFIGFQSDSNFYTGFSEDISTGGIFIATFDLRPIGSQMLVNFTLPDGHLVSTNGIVRWVREYNESCREAEPGMGVQFDRLGPEDRARIERYLVEREPIFYDE